VILEAEDVAKRFETPGGAIEVLSGLDLSVAPGETVAVVGESGSGKSTLLSLLAGLDAPTSGTIRIDGRDLAELDEAALASLRGRSMGIVFQQFHLMGV
jgi:putative ABC transport system ATP-binding protein